jgi:hypothetical protein
VFGTQWSSDAELPKPGGLPNGVNPINASNLFGGGGFAFGAVFAVIGVFAPATRPLEPVARMSQIGKNDSRGWEWLPAFPGDREIHVDASSGQFDALHFDAAAASLSGIERLQVWWPYLDPWAESGPDNTKDMGYVVRLDGVEQPLRARVDAQRVDPVAGPFTYAPFELALEPTPRKLAVGYNPWMADARIAYYASAPIKLVHLGFADRAFSDPADATASFNKKTSDVRVDVQDAATDMVVAINPPGDVLELESSSSLGKAQMRFASTNVSRPAKPTDKPHNNELSVGLNFTELPRHVMFNLTDVGQPIGHEAYTPQMPFLWPFDPANTDSPTAIQVTTDGGNVHATGKIYASSGDFGEKRTWAQIDLQRLDILDVGKLSASGMHALEVWMLGPRLAATVDEGRRLSASVIMSETDAGWKDSDPTTLQFKKKNRLQLRDFAGDFGLWVVSKRVGPSKPGGIFMGAVLYVLGGKQDLPEFLRRPEDTKLGDWFVQAYEVLPGHQDVTYGSRKGGKFNAYAGTTVANGADPLF